MATALTIAIFLCTRQDRLGKALDELGIKLNDADLRALYSKFSGGKDHILTQKFLSFFNITPPVSVDCRRAKTWILTSSVYFLYYACTR